LEQVSVTASSLVGAVMNAVCYSVKNVAAACVPAQVVERVVAVVTVVVAALLPTRTWSDESEEN